MINTTRHDSIFNSDMFSTPIHIIGLGATGSKIALEIAKLGIRGDLINLWDYDTVESHNISNQVFGIGDIDKPKAQAVAEIIKRDTGITVNYKVERVTDQEEINGIVFLLTDTMSSRKEIFENCLELNPRIKVVIETRMGTDSCRIYTFKSVKSADCDKWSNTLCGDDVAEVSACGGTISVGATSSFICACAVWQFLKYCGYDYALEEGVTQRMSEPEFEVLLWLNPFTLMV